MVLGVQGAFLIVFLIMLVLAAIVGFVLEPVTGLATVSVFVVIIFLVCLNPWDEFLTRR